MPSNNFSVSPKYNQNNTIREIKTAELKAIQPPEKSKKIVKTDQNQHS